MVNKWEIQIPELTGEEKRNAYIYLPESYQYEQEKRYPVLYMFDGHNVFFDSDATYGKSWGMKEYMDYICGSEFWKYPGKRPDYDGMDDQNIQTVY